jgi:glycerophosphoryl diester phosphodiesterase
MKKLCSLILILSLLACSKGGDSPEPPVVGPPEPTPQTPNNRVVAHRGAWKEFSFPDNSMAAFKKAIEIGVFASECDVQLTKDKKVIVYHDETIGGKYFKDVNYSEIQNLTLANGEKLPTLESFLDELLKHKTTLLWIDIKSLTDNAGGNSWGVECAKAVAATVAQKNAASFVRAIVGRKEVLDASIAASKGTYEHGYMNIDWTPTQFTNAGYNWANFTYTKYYTNANTHNAALIQQYKNAGLKLSVYTVDDAVAMDWFIAQTDIFAITSNNPFALLQKLK